MFGYTVKKLRSDRKAEAGFTLIELSIVLVIIGLIVGGVLVGQDLIKAAEIRATIAQIEKYNTAVNTFRNKYNGIPGDLAAASASQFGLFASTSASTTGYGDGNGLIEGGASGATNFIGEPAIFFRQMTDAGFIDGAYGTSGLATTGALTTSVTTTATSNGFIPPAKLGRGNSVTVGSASGINYFVITNISGISTTGSYTVGTSGGALTPQEAYNMDKKVDDGLPGTGSIFALDSNATNPSASGGFTTVTANTNCISGSGSTLAYLVSGTTQACSLRFRFN
jgi:prepilin-type N-terminal cleavage/methylation domain-containing protein